MLKTFGQFSESTSFSQSPYSKDMTVKALLELARKDNLDIWWEQEYRPNGPKPTEKVWLNDEGEIYRDSDGVYVGKLDVWA